MKYEIKELGIGGVLDQAITLLKDNFGHLLILMCVLWVPSQIAIGLMTINLVDLPQGNQAQDPEQVRDALDALEALDPRTLVIGGASALIAIAVILPLTNAAMIYTVARLYLGKSIGVGEAYGRALQVILPFFGTGILFYLILVGGFILCVIPAIIFFFWFALWRQVVIIEGVSGIAALKRSKFLMTGNIFNFFVLGLILIVINMSVNAPTQFIPNQYLSTVFQSVVSTGFVAFQAAAMVVFYFSCRCKAEAFDLELLAAAVDSSPSTDPMDDFEGNLFDE